VQLYSKEHKKSSHLRLKLEKNLYGKELLQCRGRLVLQRLDTLAILCGDELFLTTPSPARFLRFPRKYWLFPVLSAVNYLGFAATVTAFFCLLTYAG